MMFAIDIGNSFVKCALIERDRVLGRESLPTDECENVITLADMVRRVVGRILSIDGAILSSVVPRVTEKAIRVTEHQIGSKPRIVDSSMKMPFELAVPVPSQVGSDRLCAAAGAVGSKRRSAIVIDAGSAITVDVVKGRQFLGGVIAAGPSVSLRALGRYARQLPEIDFARIETPFPDQFDVTEFAMTLGAGLAAVGTIREAVRYLEAAVGSAPAKFVTGGFAPALAGRLPNNWHHEPDLTLKGLHTIASLNPTVNV
jgi:type III pantothenate kinase